MAYSMEKDFSISLNDLRENDVRAVLLTQVYNAGARRRMDIHNAIEDCKKYYPSDYTLLDVFAALMDKAAKLPLIHIPVSIIHMPIVSNNGQCTIGKQILIEPIAQVAVNHDNFSPALLQ